MNAKTAKALRRYVRDNFPTPSKFAPTHVRRTRDGVVLNEPESQRAIYRALKQLRA